MIHHQPLIFRRSFFWEGFERKSIDEELTWKTLEVTLHIYHVSTDSRVGSINEYLEAMGTGAFHAGVEVNGCLAEAEAKMVKGLDGSTCRKKHTLLFGGEWKIENEMKNLLSRYFEGSFSGLF